MLRDWLILTLMQWWMFRLSSPSVRRRSFLLRLLRAPRSPRNNIHKMRQRRLPRFTPHRTHRLIRPTPHPLLSIISNPHGNPRRTTIHPLNPRSIQRSDPLSRRASFRKCRSWKGDLVYGDESEGVDGEGSGVERWEFEVCL